MTADTLTALANALFLAASVLICVLITVHTVRFANRSMDRSLIYPPPDDRFYTDGPRYRETSGDTPASSPVDHALYDPAIDGLPDGCDQSADAPNEPRARHLPRLSEWLPVPSAISRVVAGPPEPTRPVVIPRHTRAVVTRGYFVGERVYVLSRVRSHPGEWFVRLPGGEVTVLGEGWFRVDHPTDHPSHRPPRHAP